MAGEQRHLNAAGDEDPFWRLWPELPEPWKGPVMASTTGTGSPRTATAASTLPVCPIWSPPNCPGWRTGRPWTGPGRRCWAPTSSRTSCAARSATTTPSRPRSGHGLGDGGRLAAVVPCHPLGPASAARQRRRLRVIFRFSRLALLARCTGGPWWSLDEWHPRCDPRIPPAEHEPQAHYGCSPSKIGQPWLREAVKWCLGTQLEAGTLRWSTVSQERMRCFVRFDRWLETFTDPLDVLGDPAHAVQLAAAFRPWGADPANRLLRQNEQRIANCPVSARQINDDLRAVAELFAFVAANPAEARQVLGPNPWSRVTTHTGPAGSARSPASHTSGSSTTSTTPTTTCSPRSPPPCPCSALGATNRCWSPAATGSRPPPAASTTRRPCA